MDVLVIGRSGDCILRLDAIASARAALAGRQIHFEHYVANIHDAGILPVLQEFNPDGVLLCASHQSPAEGKLRPSAWTDLLGSGGYGSSLPLQADLAVVAGRHAADVDAWFVNACLPDLVNPVLRALGIPVLCGVGNVSVLAAAIQSELELSDQRELALLAHHVHLHHALDDPDEARAWHQAAALDVHDLLAPVRAAGSADSTELNHITGYAAALVIDALLTGEELVTSLPGPHGLPGGYPVRVHDGTVTLRLPAMLSREAAISTNQRWSLLDGAVVEGDRVRFGRAASIALAPYLPDLADGFDVTELAAACKYLLDLRARLRSQTGEQP